MPTINFRKADSTGFPIHRQLVFKSGSWQCLLNERLVGRLKLGKKFEDLVLLLVNAIGTILEFKAIQYILPLLAFPISARVARRIFPRTASGLFLIWPQGNTLPSAPITILNAWK